MLDQAIVFAILFAALVLFIWGRPRYDAVALLSLLAVVVTGIVPAREAFSGMGHPAVVTVAAVLVISRGLSNAGIVTMMATWLERFGTNVYLQIGSLVALVTVASGLMNNVGALALTMPLAVGMATRAGRSPSYYLIPIAFGSLLGGMTTLIGTPPNLIISGFREQTLGQAYGMFDFLPVGGLTTLAGVVFLTFIGWKFIPVRKGQASPDSLFHIEDYLVEVRIPEDSEYIDQPIDAVEAFHETDTVIVGLSRGGKGLIHLPAAHEELEAGDVLLVEADKETLETFLQKSAFELAGSKDFSSEMVARVQHPEEAPADPVEAETTHMDIQEVVVRSNSRLAGRNVREANLRTRFGVNLLAAARQGERVPSLLKDVRFKPGDILLIQGSAATIADAMTRLGCIPLFPRQVSIGAPRGPFKAAAIFIAAILLTSLEVLPVQIALSMAALGMIFARIIPMREIYTSVEWPVIVLLGAMMPLGTALESTGGAATVAELLLSVGAGLPSVVTLGLLFAVTMVLSNIINNAAAAVLMAPIAIGIANSLGVSVDPFLMATCIACSAPFLTPIGHQSCTLVMGPGGYRFGDYWRLGLPLSILVGVCAIPLVLVFWPL
ncbi:MAG: SLC13 family permease [Desulfobacterales bacterium]|nr:SLC13 family permease [Desulfobacterales bacterium]